MKTNNILISTAILMLASLSVHSANITVFVKGVENNKGKINLALDDSAKNYAIDNKVDTAKFAVQLDAKVETIKVVIPNIEPGEYSLSIFHDQNGNEQIDTNFFGVPTEGYAFSSNVVGVFGKPTFEEVKFDLKQGQNMSTTITLNY